MSVPDTRYWVTDGNQRTLAEPVSLDEAKRIALEASEDTLQVYIVEEGDRWDKPLFFAYDGVLYTATPFVSRGGA
jgi:hypothetical protein